MPKRIPRSLKKFIRQEKSRIRREILDQQKVKEEIQKLYQKLNITKG